jgi:hypothetical protein
MILLSYFLMIVIAAYILWSLFSFIFAIGRRKQKFMHAGLGILALLAAAWVGGDAIEQDAMDAGFAGYDDKRAAETAGITDPGLWKARKAEQQRIADAAAAREQAEADRLAREAEEKAARDAAVEAEKRAELKRAETEKFEAAMAEMKRLAAERKAREAKSEREEDARLAEEEREKEKAAADCLQSLDCIWESQRAFIYANCRMSVESLAKWDHEWVDAMFDPPFHPAGWAKKEQGLIMAWGNKLKLQNGFGAWKQVAYFCAYDPKTKKAVDASVVTD